MADNGNGPVLALLKQINGKIDRLFDYLPRVLGTEIADQETYERRQQASNRLAGGPETTPDLTIFKLDANPTEKTVKYREEDWNYEIGDRIQWVSETGPFTVKIDSDYGDIQSPFAEEVEPHGRLNEIHGKREPATDQPAKGKPATGEPETKRWVSPVVVVRSPFREEERATRRAARVGKAKYRYTVAATDSKTNPDEPKTFINERRRGGTVC